MLHLVQSNKMEVLEAHLVAIIEQNASSNSDLSNILTADTILVQSPGMAQWLKICLAESLGIAANFEFPLPSSYIWSYYSKYVDDLPQVSAYSKGNMAWKILAILPNLISRPEFAEIKQYLDNDTGLKSYQLSQKIADVFDQYLMYRPEWVLAWEQGQDLLPDAKVELHPWQPLLWRELVAKTKALGESSHHRANLHETLLSFLDAETSQPKASQKPLYVFGISALPQQQLDILKRIGRYREVYIFWCNPSQHYWGDMVDEKYRAKAKLKQQNENLPEQFLESGNPLLTSWGKLGRDYQEMLLNIEVEQHDLFVEVPAKSMLQNLQNEVFDLTMRRSNAPLSAEELLTNGVEFPKIEINTDDDSIQFHRCHSKVRELEVLHDFLLQQFNADANLKPGDVIVMMPDVASYAPYISGVFGSVDASLYIPFAISDRNAAQESKIIKSFVSLISLHQSRLTLSELLSVLEVPAIQQKFEITDKEFEVIRYWLIDVGVRWGWDSEDKSRWNIPEQSQNTLLFGLTRLLAGYALNNDSLLNGKDSLISPYVEIEGQQALALGKLYSFCEKLNQTLRYCQQTANLQDKVDAGLQLIESFYLVDENEQVYINQLRQTLEQIALHQHQYSEDIGQDVFVNEVTQNLDDKGVGQRFLAGSVNFCTLMPMRSIPFSRVCLLGLNDTDYPRKSMPIGFDLMLNSNTKRGDRSRRFDDRYLFLEAILSARQQLYISYLGYNIRDNSECIPSILVSELLDYCHQTYCLEGDLEKAPEVTRNQISAHLLHSHGLQPFSPRYFSESFLNLRSFQAKWLNVLKTHESKQQESGSEFYDVSLASPFESIVDTDNFELDRLLAFLLNPAKGLFQQRWKTSLQLFHEEIIDDEPFSLNALDRYKLGEQLLDEYISGAQSREKSQLNQSDFTENLRAQGALPYGVIGETSLENMLAHTDALFEAIEEYVIGNTKSKQEIQLNIDGINLVGWVDNIYNGDLILVRSGDIRAKDKFTLWVNWLCLCAQRDCSNHRSRFLGTKKPYALQALSQQDAMQQLTALMVYCEQGLSAPLHFYIETAYIWVTSGDRKKTQDKFVGNDFSRGEGSEPNIARLCPDLNRVFEQFDEVSHSILGSMIAHEVKP